MIDLLQADGYLDDCHRRAAHSSQDGGALVTGRPRTRHRTAAHSSQDGRALVTGRPRTRHRTAAHSSQDGRALITGRPRTHHRTAAHSSQDGRAARNVNTSGSRGSCAQQQWRNYKWRRVYRGMKLLRKNVDSSKENYRNVKKGFDNMYQQ